jgi:hypothetical protein
MRPSAVLQVLIVVISQLLSAFVTLTSWRTSLEEIDLQQESMQGS